MQRFSQTGLRTQAESPGETYKRPLQDKHYKKVEQRVVKDVNSTIFDLNGRSSGCGGHICFFSLPEAFAIPPQKCLKSCVTSHYP